MSGENTNDNVYYNRYNMIVTSFIDLVASVICINFNFYTEWQIVVSNGAFLYSVRLVGSKHSHTHILCYNGIEFTCTVYNIIDI